MTLAAENGRSVADGPEKTLAVLTSEITAIFPEKWPGSCQDHLPRWTIY